MIEDLLYWDEAEEEYFRKNIIPQFGLDKDPDNPGFIRLHPHPQNKNPFSKESLHFKPHYDVSLAMKKDRAKEKRKKKKNGEGT